MNDPFSNLTVEQHNQLQLQLDEDTCVAHKVFCCDKCFDMRTVGTPFDIALDKATADFVLSLLDGTN